MEFLWKTGSVFGLGILELWAGIPAGFALGLPPWLTGLAAGAGSVLGALLVILLGDRLRNWILRKRGKEKSEESRMHRIWNRYGVAGLGLLSPLLTGAPLGAALGVAFGASPRRLLAWMSIGIAAWSVILTTLAALGVSVFHQG